MKLKRFFFFLILDVVFSMNAQVLRLKLPAHAGGDVKISIRKGILSDTIVKGVLDQLGGGEFDFRTLVSRVGIATITIKPAVNYEFILSPEESPVVECVEKKVSPQNTNILNSNENAHIVQFFGRYSLLNARIRALQSVLQLYPASGSFNAASNHELDEVNKASKLFNDSIDRLTCYAAKFLLTRQVLTDKIEFAWKNDSLKSQVRNFVLNRLDVDFIFGSGLYFNFFNGLSMNVYQKESIFHGRFGIDMVELLKRTKNQEVFVAFSTDFLSICEKLGWEKDAEKVTDYILESKRILHPSRRLKVLLKENAIREGKSAPCLVSTNNIFPVSAITYSKSKYSLVMFYETGCSHCEKELDELRANYPLLVSMGVEIVTISSDQDVDTFKQKASSFPWKYRICDLKGVGGVNFENFGIVGTPSIYIIDNKGKIVKRTALFQDVMNCMKR